MTKKRLYYFLATECFTFHMKELRFEEFSLMKNKFTPEAFIPADTRHLFTKHKGLHFLHLLRAAASVLGNNDKYLTKIQKCWFYAQSENIFLKRLLHSI